MLAKATGALSVGVAAVAGVYQFGYLGKAWTVRRIHQRLVTESATQRSDQPSKYLSRPSVEAEIHTALTTRSKERNHREVVLINCQYTVGKTTAVTKVLETLRKQGYVVRLIELGNADAGIGFELAKHFGDPGMHRGNAIMIFEEALSKIPPGKEPVIALDLNPNVVDYQTVLHMSRNVKGYADTTVVTSGHSSTARAVQKSTMGRARILNVFRFSAKEVSAYCDLMEYHDFKKVSEYVATPSWVTKAWDGTGGDVSRLNEWIASCDNGFFSTLKREYLHRSLKLGIKFTPEFRPYDLTQDQFVEVQQMEDDGMVEIDGTFNPPRVRTFHPYLSK